MFNYNRVSKDFCVLKQWSKANMVIFNSKKKLCLIASEIGILTLGERRIWSRRRLIEEYSGCLGGLVD